MKELSVLIGAVILGIVFTACGPMPANTNIAGSNANTGNFVANSSNLNASNANSTLSSSPVEAKEPEKYQALVKLNFEALGDQQNAALPAITATVARSGGDRRMEFTLPTGEKAVYLDAAGNHYLILPNRRQYAELTREAVGFEVRRMLMPEQIVNQVKAVQGVERVGEEVLNGRKVVKYRYAATTNTQTRAGEVGTESYLLIDAETGLPLRSETVSQSQSGGNVQGYKGVKLVTEMSDIRMDPDPGLFTVPTDFAKIDPEQVRAQVSLIFNAAAAIVGEALRQQRTAPPLSPAPAR